MYDLSKMKRFFLIFFLGLLFYGCASSKKENPSIKKSNIIKSQESNTVRKICLDLGFEAGNDDFIDCVIKIASNLEKTNLDNEQSVSISNFKNSEEKQVYFPDDGKTSSKLVAEYEKYPDEVLCIAYINNYGIFFKESKQQGRAEVIRRRKLDCSQYRDAAFFDKQNRTNAIIDATKKALDENAENKRRAAELYMQNRNRYLDCTSRRVGDRISTSCY